MNIHRIIPATPDHNGRIVARGVVRGVYEMNPLGELVPVQYRQNPMDGVEVLMLHAPKGRVYVAIDESPAHAAVRHITEPNLGEAMYSKYSTSMYQARGLTLARWEDLGQSEKMVWNHAAGMQP